MGAKIECVKACLSSKKPKKPHIYKGTKKPLIISLATLGIVALIVILIVFNKGQFAGKAVADVRGEAGIVVPAAPYAANAPVPVYVDINPLAAADGSDQKVYGIDLEVVYPDSVEFVAPDVNNLITLQQNNAPVGNWVIEAHDDTPSDGKVTIRGYDSSFTGLSGRFSLQGLRFMVKADVQGEATGIFTLEKAQLGQQEGSYISSRTPWDLGERVAGEPEEGAGAPTLTVSSAVVSNENVEITFTSSVPIGVADSAVHIKVGDAMYYLGSGILLSEEYILTIPAGDDGAHTVTLELVQADHVSYDPAVTAEATWTVGGEGGDGGGLSCLPIGDVDTYDDGAGNNGRGVLNPNDVLSLQYVLAVSATKADDSCGTDGQGTCDDFADDGYYVCKNGVIFGEAGQTCAAVNCASVPGYGDVTLIGDVDTYDDGAGNNGRGVLNPNDVLSLQYVLAVSATKAEDPCGTDGQGTCDDFADDGYYVCKNGIIYGGADHTC